MRKLLLLVIILTLLLFGIEGLQKYSPFFSNPLSNFVGTNPSSLPQEKVKVVTEESVVISTVKNYAPSVVTVAEQVDQSASAVNPFDSGPFSFFGQTIPGQGQSQPQGPQNIGSGFIVSSDGMIVTNKHVVADTSGKYQIITSNDKKYTVQKIYRDPLNDVAILKIDPSQNPGVKLKPVVLGDSSHLQVGQFVIAIGTPLGQFSNTVTTGVISGLGRGITAGSQFEGFAEKLDNVIQTSAAINPGNSGGPLLNSSSQVIGVNTAVAQSAQNIGFALPINVIKDSLKNFNETGKFNRPFLGVSYKTLSLDLAIANDVPEGAYVLNVVASSPADKAGLQKGDIITKIDGQKVGNNLAGIISKKKVGDTLTITYWRDGKTQDISVTLGNATSQ